jgi:hypothetical protein
MFGIIFEGNSIENNKVFLQQKRIARTLLVINPRTTCKPHFKTLGIMAMIVTNWFSQTQQCNYDKGGQGYMFRPQFEATFRPFVVEQLIKFLHMGVSVLWDPKQLYRVIKTY